MRQLKLFLLLLIVNLSFGAVGFYTIPSIPAEHGGFAAIDMSKYRTSFYTPCKFESVNNLDIVYRNDSLFVKPLPEAKGYYPLEFRVGNNVHTLMIKISKTELIEFKYPDRKGVKAVHLMGNFNDWSRTGLPCKKGRDGNWQIEKFLKPGKWEYKFVVDRAEILDPFNPDSLPNGLGGFNSILKIGADDRLKPGEFRKENYSVSPNSTQVYYKYYPGIPFENIRPENLRILLNNDVLPKGSWELAENDLILNLENPWRDGLLRIFAVNNYGDIIQENHLIIKDGVPLNTKNHPG
nr:hypothetical protein [FCB group bacterium]